MERGIDFECQTREAIDAKLLAALESGEPVEATPEGWEQQRKVLARRIAAGRNALDENKDAK